jgi:hypothetical protein
MVGTRHVPHRVRPTRAYRIHGTGRSWAIGDLHSIRTTGNHQDDRCYLCAKQKLLPVIQEHLSSGFRMLDDLVPLSFKVSNQPALLG